MFSAAGWQVITVKYGRVLQELFRRPGGTELRARIDDMTNRISATIALQRPTAASAPSRQRR
jgi:pyruvate dehydrogenase complex dehydrogenase (E1) component